MPRIRAPRSGTSQCAAIIAAHCDVGMLSEHHGPGAEKSIGMKVWGDKLCVPSHITLDSPIDERSLWTRLEDAMRAFVGCPRHLPVSYAHWRADRRDTIRTYIEERGATVVAMLRNPNHVIDSIRRRYGPGTAKKGKYLWAQAVRTIHRAKQEYGEVKRLVRFYDLVTSLEAATRKICCFIDVEYDHGMIEGEGINQYSKMR
ncbi:hypothetical protein BSZ35_11125 [Salinibacter sp. 10B]|nr:hypothetical protein BSZ35_11125 [Salinibacter sp. 10B]